MLISGDIQLVHPSNLCFEDDLSLQHATFFPPITFDIIPQFSSSYTNVCTKISSISLSVTLLAGEGRIYLLFSFFFFVFFLVLVKVIAMSKSEMFTVASHSKCFGNKLHITTSLSCSSIKTLAVVTLYHTDFCWSSLSAASPFKSKCRGCFFFFLTSEDFNLNFK